MDEIQPQAEEKNEHQNQLHQEHKPIEPAMAEAKLPEQEKKPKKPGWYTKPAWVLCATIFVSALLVSGSLFYNTNLLVKQLVANNDSAMAVAGAQTTAPAAAAAPAAPAAAAPTTPDPIALTSRSNQPTLGSSSAKVTMVEFGDFQCPYCKEFFQQSFSQIKSQYVDTGKVKYVFRDFPLSQIHVNAQIAAVAAECANEQGKFWDYHNLLYTNGQSDGTNLDQASLEKYADQLSLNSGTFGFGKNKFDQCLQSNATLPTVNADQALGTSLGVSGTPSFVILKGSDNTIDVNAVHANEQSGQSVITLSNGNVFIIGAQPLSTFQQALDAALKN